MERKHDFPLETKTVTVRELTVGEVVRILDGDLALPEGIVWLDHMLEGPIDSALIMHCTGMRADDLEALYPKEAQSVADKVGELNPFFARVLGKLRAKLLELQRSAS